jgi:hypothetical protein
LPYVSILIHVISRPVASGLFVGLPSWSEAVQWRG